MRREILGQSPLILKLNQMIERVAATKTNILIVGESGTGKELVARKIHELSTFKGNPFVPVNCGAIPETLIESELFGYKRGSFTGAFGDKQGLFEAADGGTLFLDEVGEIPLHMQVKLLRALQDRTIRKVGGTEDIRVEVRIIAATNRDLETAVKKGAFREDLFYRLNVIMVRPPPLRERPGDVEIIANAFLSEFSERFGKKPNGFSADAMRALKAYHWPGNVRELENVVERAIALESGVKINLETLPRNVIETATASVASSQVQRAELDEGEQFESLRLPAPDFSKGALDLDGILAGVERTYLESALKETGGVKKKAAELLGITFRSIRYRLKKNGQD